MLVWYVAGEGVELTVHKESVVVEEIQEVEHVVMHQGRLPVKKLRRLLHEKKKVRIFVWKGIWKKYHFLLFPLNWNNNHDAEVYAPIVFCYHDALTAFLKCSKVSSIHTQ